VGEWEGDMFIHRTQDTHRKRTYVFLDGTLRVTVGSETREMIPPSKRECAA
jgi:mannose-6-phosphate isomerase-like protein (cupin superfamily)